MTPTEELLREALTARAESVQMPPHAWSDNARRLPRARRRRAIRLAALVVAAGAAAVAAVAVPRQLGYFDPIAAGTHVEPLHMTPFDPALVDWRVGQPPTAAWVSPPVMLTRGSARWILSYQDDQHLCVGVYTDGSRELANEECVMSDITFKGGTGDEQDVHVDVVAAPSSVAYAKVQRFDRSWSDANVLLAPAGHPNNVVVYETLGPDGGCSAKRIKEFDAGGRRVHTWGGPDGACDSTRQLPDGTSETRHFQ